MADRINPEPEFTRAELDVLRNILAIDIPKMERELQVVRHTTMHEKYTEDLIFVKTLLAKIRGKIGVGTCIFPGCTTTSDDDRWCRQHYGLFPHTCEHPGCDTTVQYDDEPYCFKHSPDSGSSVRGYSASAKAGA